MSIDGSENQASETPRQSQPDNNLIEIQLPWHGYVPERFTVSGINGIPGSYPVTVRRAHTFQSLGSGPVNPDGGWAVDVTMPSGVFEMEIYASQPNNRNPDNYRRFHRYLATLTKPNAHAVLRADQVVFGGTRFPDTRIWVFGDSVLLAYLDNVLPERTWEITSANKLSTGNYSLKARYKVGNLTGESVTPEVPITVVGELTITTSPVEQERSFKLKGKDALGGAKVEVMLDPDSIVVGETTAMSGGSWEVDMRLLPGPAILFAEQIYSSVRSLPSAPRAFRIRPLRISLVRIDDTTAPTMRMSGSGHVSATVQIAVESGPDATPPPEVEVQEGGLWSTTATDWPLGTYSLKAIQKVPDGAGGWIESMPYIFTFDRGLPDNGD